MQLSFLNKKTKIYISSLFVAVVLLLAIFRGGRLGHEIAQSEAVSNTVESLVQGLQYFHQDQNRYPQATEFSDKSIMLNYFSIFPVEEFVSENCNAMLKYNYVDRNNFVLNFCLPGRTEKYNSGWNVLSVTPSQIK